MPTTESPDLPPLVPGRDWTYSEACGCTVRFLVNARYKTSRMLPSIDCNDHRMRDQTDARTALRQRAKVALAGLLAARGN